MYKLYGRRTIALEHTISVGSVLCINAVSINNNIDLSKAYDMLSFNIILQNLKCYGIVENIFQFLTSYLEVQKTVCHFQ